MTEQVKGCGEIFFLLTSQLSTKGNIILCQNTIALPSVSKLKRLIFSKTWFKNLTKAFIAIYNVGWSSESASSLILRLKSVLFPVLHNLWQTEKNSFTYSRQHQLKRKKVYLWWSHLGCTFIIITHPTVYQLYIIKRASMPSNWSNIFEHNGFKMNSRNTDGQMPNYLLQVLWR